MYNFDYIIEDVKPKNGEMRDVHFDVMGRPAQPVRCEIGHSGIIEFMPSYDNRPHTLRTSEIRRVEMENDGSMLILETRNTKYTLRKAV